MTRFSELTDEQVLALTPDEVERYKDYECAMEGAPLLPTEPGPKPEKPEQHKDATVYGVAGILLGSQDEANRLIEVLGTLARFKLEYVSGPSYERVVERADDTLSSSTEQHYTRAGWERDRAAVTDYEQKAKEWETAREEYKKTLSRRNEVTIWIDERIDRVRESEQRRIDMEAKLARYLDLAGGDEKVALRFLFNAHPDAAELFPQPEEAAEEMPEDDDDAR